MKNLPKKFTAAPTTPKSRPLTEEDYKFSDDRVPDQELVPCLLFEFLRESIAARQLEQGLIVKLAAGGDHADIEKLFDRLHTLRFNINHPLEIGQFIEYTIAPAWGHTDLLKTPWQRLPPETKATLKCFCNDVDKPASISTSEFETNELHKKMQNDVRRGLEAFQKDNQSPSTEYARAPLDELDGYTGRVIYGVVADYARHDDNAIRAALDLVKEEIIKNRPNGIKPQARKESGLGRPDEWRGKLNSLGRTRLYCHYDGVDALKRGNPTAHKSLVAGLKDNGDRAALKALADAKARFVRAFHEILPFEKGALPLCVANSRFNR